MKKLLIVLFFAFLLLMCSAAARADDVIQIGIERCPTGDATTYHFRAALQPRGGTVWVNKYRTTQTEWMNHLIKTAGVDSFTVKKHELILKKSPMYSWAEIDDAVKRTLGNGQKVKMIKIKR